MIYPLDKFPDGTSINRARAAALRKAPLRGAINVLVILVDFPDKPFDQSSTKEHFEVINVCMPIQPAVKNSGPYI